MVKATELMIGNLVTLGDKQRKELWCNQIHAQNEFFEVKTIYSDNDIALELDDEIVDISEVDVEPIPLSRELLLKFNFYENRSNNSWQLDTKYGFSIWGRIDKGFYVYVESDEIGNKIEYVHQLQNLYFALTGKELTLEN